MTPVIWAIVHLVMVVLGTLITTYSIEHRKWWRCAGWVFLTVLHAAGLAWRCIEVVG